MTENEVRQKLAEFCRSTAGGSELVVATVTGVDKTARTCTIDNDGVQYFGVRLQPVTKGSNGLVLFPALNSFVLATAIEGGDMAVILCSDYESAVWNINSLTLNDGGNGGLVISENLKSELDKVIGRVNDIVMALTHIAAAAAATAQAPVLGAALGTLITSNITAITAPLLNPAKTAFENDKTKH